MLFYRALLVDTSVRLQWCGIIFVFAVAAIALLLLLGAARRWAPVPGLFAFECPVPVGRRIVVYWVEPFISLYWQRHMVCRVGCLAAVGSIGGGIVFCNGLDRPFK